jgi:hypothetical protein
MGVDIGQRRDPTAVCVAQIETRPYELGTEEHFNVRHLERLALGTPYPDVALRLAEVANGVKGLTGVGPSIYVDATGVGQPLVDILRRACQTGQIFAVYFNHGDRRLEPKVGEVSLGKAWLVSRLQTLLQAGRIHLPPTHEAQALAKELLDYEIRVDTDANDRYGAFKVGTHDDLVTALGLAVQHRQRSFTYARARPLPASSTRTLR